MLEAASDSWDDNVNETCKSSGQRIREGVRLACKLDAITSHTVVDSKTERVPSPCLARGRDCEAGARACGPGDFTVSDEVET
jgi:hypothetical protein